MFALSTCLALLIQSSIKNKAKLHNVIPCGKRLVVFPGNCEWDLSKDEKNHKDNENNPKCYNSVKTFIITDSNTEMKLFKINWGTSLQNITLTYRAHTEIYKNKNKQTKK